jgi:hypothetical protein
MVLDSAVDIHKQPNPEPVALGKCTLILFLISLPVIWSFGMLSHMIICIVLIVVIFLGLLTTSWNKQFPLRAFITLSWVGPQQEILFKIYEHDLSSFCLTLLPEEGLKDLKVSSIH